LHRLPDATVVPQFNDSLRIRKTDEGYRNEQNRYKGSHDYSPNRGAAAQNDEIPWEKFKPF
jgi:hypothetical protein